MLLFEFDIDFVVRKAIKGQAIIDYLVDQSLNDKDFSKSLFPDEDVLAVGKIGFASHTKHAAKAAQGFTSFMRDNI